MIACQTTPPEPARLQVDQPARVIEVEKIVATPCITRADLPVAPTPTKVDIKTASKRQVAAAVSIDDRQQREYTQKLEAMLLKCLR